MLEKYVVQSHKPLPPNKVEIAKQDKATSEFIIQNLLQDNAVLDENVKMYDRVCQRMVKEIIGLRNELALKETESDTLTICRQELKKCEYELKIVERENKKLSEKNHELLAVINLAAEAEDDPTVEKLQAENDWLRSVVMEHLTSADSLQLPANSSPADSNHDNSLLGSSISSLNSARRARKAAREDALNRSLPNSSPSDGSPSSPKDTKSGSVFAGVSGNVASLLNMDEGSNTSNNPDDDNSINSLKKSPIKTSPEQQKSKPKSPSAARALYSL